MLFSIIVNNKKIMAEKGETILSALNRNGIIIPTLCRMKEFTPTGACRLCVVEVEGRDRLVTACSQPVEEWMNIKTHSPRVIRARKIIVELLLSKHPDDCLYCIRNLNCELQRLAEELNIGERRIKGKKIKQRLDQSGHAVVRELSKCILCGRCVRVCEEVVNVTAIDFINRGQKTHVGTSMDLDFNFTSCINCGQCLNVCPTGALHEKQNIPEVQEYLSNKDFLKVIQYTPLVPASVAAELGIKPPKDFDRVLNGILRRMGFNKVFHSGFGTDILIEEIADEIIGKNDSGFDEPLYVSACPAWVKYAEQSLPNELKNLSVLKPPLQITGALVKTLVSSLSGIKPQQIYSVAVTPCTAMKFEARRDSMMTKGICDIDTVLTVRELARLIRLYGIDTAGTEGEPADEPMALSSASAILAETAGGIAEGVVRSVFLKSAGKIPDRKIFKNIRNSTSFRDAQFTTGTMNFSVAIVDGLAGMGKLREALSAGRKYNLIEVMACSGGCVNGGGMSPCRTKEDLKTRIKQVYQSEESALIQSPSASPPVLNFYEKHMKNTEILKDKKVLHTSFSKRDVLL